MSKDPVCGMDVQEEEAPSFEYQGTMYYFCCEGCKKSFSASPEKYLNQSDQQAGHEHHHH